MPPGHGDPADKCLPGVDPPRPCTMTFSAQRCEFRPRPPLPFMQINDASQSSSQDVQAVLQSGALQAPTSVVGFLHPHDLALSRITRVGNSDNGVKHWLHPIYDCAKDFIGEMGGKIASAVVAIWVPLRSGCKALWDWAGRTMGLFKMCVRRVIGPMVGSGVSTVRVEV